MQLDTIIEFSEFILVGLLGLMPLIVIHWADRRSRTSTRRKQHAWRQIFAAVKLALLVICTDWIMTIHL